MRSLSSFRDVVLLLLACEAPFVSARPPLQQPLLQHAYDDASDDASDASHGAVACESAICSRIGIDLMKQGGTAADAMVGTTLCVGVMGMYHSGIGGGGFMLVRDPDGHYENVDYRETAPAAAYEDMYEGNAWGSVVGGLAVGVPGELRGLEYLHKKHGALPWKTVVMPAVHVARNGFPVSEDLVRYMNAAIDYVGPFLIESPVWAEDFAPNGKLLKLGDRITRKRYAKTLETIANEGIETFYEGDMAKDMVELIRANNGSMTLEDFENYEVIVRPAVSTTFRGRKLYSTGAPSSGAIALSILKAMEQYSPADNSDPDNVNLTTHRFDEAMRFGYGARTRLGDPQYVDGITSLEADLLSTDRAIAVRHKIQDDQTLPIDAYDPDMTYAEPGHGTSHIVTADRSGLAISSTTTINTLFGSLLMTSKGGIILNNEMNDFSIPRTNNEFGFPPSRANFIRGGKRPLSSITPVMAEDIDDAQEGEAAGGAGRLYLVTGAAGGSRIISATAQVAWHVLEHGMTIGEALAEPRLHDQLAPNRVQFERQFDKGIVASMKSRGHHVEWATGWGSAAQGLVWQPDGAFNAAGEPRQLNSGGDVF